MRSSLVPVRGLIPASGWVRPAHRLPSHQRRAIERLRPKLAASEAGMLTGYRHHRRLPLLCRAVRIAMARPDERSKEGHEHPADGDYRHLGEQPEHEHRQPGGQEQNLKAARSRCRLSDDRHVDVSDAVRLGLIAAPGSNVDHTVSSARLDRWDPRNCDVTLGPRCGASCARSPAIIRTVVERSPGCSRLFRDHSHRARIPAPSLTSSQR